MGPRLYSEGVGFRLWGQWATGPEGHTGLSGHAGPEGHTGLSGHAGPEGHTGLRGL